MKYTSDQEVLNHLKPSELGELASRINKFRKFTCSEYFASCDACQEHRIKVTNKSLKKGEKMTLLLPLIETSLI